MSTSQEKLMSVLLDPKFDGQTIDNTRSEAIADHIKLLGWSPVYEFLVSVLRNRQLKGYWGDMIEVLWGGVLDSRTLDSNQVIAILCRCRQLNADLDENLIWSVVAKLKGIDYLSDYDPLLDPTILAELKKLGD